MKTSSKVVNTADMKSPSEIAKANKKIVSKESGCIVLHGPYEYCIELHRCSTAENILGWVDQIAGKAWVTKEMISLFVLHASGHHGIKIHPI